MSTRTSTAKLQPEHRYEAGLASLATEVLRLAVDTGVEPARLKDNIWAEYLRWHQQQMQSGVMYGGTGVHAVSVELDAAKHRKSLMFDFNKRLKTKH